MSRLSAIAVVIALLLSADFALAQGARPPAPSTPARYEPDKLRSALMAIVPPRLALDAVSVEDDRGTVSGTAKTQAQVSDFLRAIDRAGDFQRAELRSIRIEGDQYAFDIGLQIACAHGPAKSGPRLSNPPPGRSNTVHRCKVNGTLTFQATPCAPGQEG
jgi:hypothetical protein